MARELRPDYPGAHHHLYNRAIAHLLMFGSRADFIWFMRLLGDLDRFGISIYAYCLMTNHFHLFVLSREGRVSEAMQMLGSRFVRRHNWMDGRRGPLFESRFKNRLVQTGPYSLALPRYIHLNPPEAGMVDLPERYEYSSYAPLMGLAEMPPFLDPSFVLGQFGGDRSALREFTEQGVDERTRRAVESSATLLGDTRFLPEVEESLTHAGVATKGLRLELPAGEYPDPHDVLAFVCGWLNVEPEVLMRVETRRSRPERDLAIWAVRVLSRLTLTATGEVFGIGPGAVDNAIRRAANGIATGAEIEVLRRSASEQYGVIW